MKKLIVLLFVLWTGVNASARESHYYPFRYSDEIKQKDIDLYKKELEKCDQAFNKEAKAAATTAGMLKSNYDAVSCYKSIAEQIIDKYYSETATEHKEIFRNYVKQTYRAYDYIYLNADECGQSGCGTMYNVLSKDAVTKLVNTMVTEYIMLLERSIAF